MSESLSVFAPAWALFFQSLLIGLSIAAPVGPIGLLTLQRSLTRGSAVGLATGLGAAVADACYGAVGAFGVSGLIAALTDARRWLVPAGAAFLLWMAWGTWRARPAEQAARSGEASGARPPGLLACFAGTFLLTLSNPATILSFIAVFGALAGRFQGGSPLLMVAGVFTGSALWWWLLSTLAGRWRERFDAAWRRRINRASALLLAGLALWQLWGWLFTSSQA